VHAGQSAHRAPPITYQLSEPRKNRTRKEEGAMVVIVHYDLAKLDSKEAWL
jgi:hypothetical protein